MTGHSHYPVVTSILVIATCGLTPLYILPSGTINTVDVPIIVLSLLLIISSRAGEVETAIELTSPFIPYIAWILAVNFCHALNAFDSKPHILGAVQSIYGFYLLFIFIMAFNRVLSHPKRFLFLYLGILLACLTPWFTFIPFAAGRNSLSFNNPNQLGYYALLLFLVLIFAGLAKYKERKQITFTDFMVNGIVLIVCNMFAYLSGSRAGIVAVGLLDICVIAVIFRVLKDRMAKVVWLSLCIAFSLWFASNHFMKHDPPHPSDSSLSRLEKKEFIDTRDIYHRTLGMLRFDSDAGIILGNGGLWQPEAPIKLSRQVRKEVHNAILAVLNDYGFIGLMLFTIASLVYISRLKVPYKYLWMVPLLWYNMGHQGLRFRFFWITLALIAAVSVFISRRDTASAQESTIRPARFVAEMP